MARKRYDDTTVRSDQILDAAITLAVAFGYDKVTREQIAMTADCSVGLVSKYYGTMLQLKRAIVSAAIVRENLTIIAQALVDNHTKVKSAPDELKRRAMSHVLGE